MLHGREILLAVADQHRAVEFRIAADIVVVAGVEGCTAGLAPHLLRPDSGRRLKMARVSRVSRRRRQLLAALQDQDRGAAAGQAGGDRGAAHAGADDDDIGAVPWSLSGCAARSPDRRTPPCQVEGERRAVPGWMLASARSRATTSLPPRLVTAKVSEPAGSTTSMWQSAVAMLRGVAVGAFRIGQRLGPDAEDDLLALECRQARRRIGHRQRDRLARLALRARRTAHCPLAPIVAGIRFMAGEPMKSATNRLAGLL